MERFCGALQPAIRSRRFPYASLNRYALDLARLTQIKLLYGSTVRAQLRPKPRSAESGTCIPGCEFFWPPSCGYRYPAHV